MTYHSIKEPPRVALFCITLNYTIKRNSKKRNRQFVTILGKIYSVKVFLVKITAGYFGSASHHVVTKKLPRIKDGFYANPPFLLQKT